jgi:hypothetical protein
MSVRRCHHAWQRVTSGRRAVRVCAHCPAVRPARVVRGRDGGRASVRVVAAVGVLVLAVPVAGLFVVAVAVLATPGGVPSRFADVPVSVSGPAAGGSIVWDSPAVDTSRVEVR